MNTETLATVPAPAFDETPDFPYKLNFVDCDSSDAVRSHVETYLAKAGRIHQRVVSAEVMIRIPHRHRTKHHFHVHIYLDVPGHRFVVDREPEIKDTHLDPYQAIHDAFRNLYRQMEDHTRIRKGR